MYGPSRVALLASAATVACAALALFGCDGGGGGGPPALPVVSIAAEDPLAAEAATPDTGTFRVSRTGDTSAELVVYFSVTSGAGEAPGCLSELFAGMRLVTGAASQNTTIPGCNRQGLKYSK